MSLMRPTRRGFLTALGGVAAFAPVALRRAKASPFSADRVVKSGRLKQSVSRWPYNAIPLPDFCKAIAEMGLTAIDLLEEPDWAVARDHGLTLSLIHI